METKGIWNEKLEETWLQQARNDILKAFKTGEDKLKPKWTEMFEEVYKYMPTNIK